MEYGITVVSEREKRSAYKTRRGLLKAVASVLGTVFRVDPDGYLVAHKSGTCVFVHGMPMDEVIAELEAMGHVLADGDERRGG